MARGDDDAPPCPHHPSGGAQDAAAQRRQEIDLVFDRRHLGVGRRDGQRGITAGDIGQRAHGTAMKTALLLRDPVRVRKLDHAQARADLQQSGAQMLHHALTLETGLHPLKQGGMQHFGSRQITHGAGSLR